MIFKNYNKNIDANICVIGSGIGGSTVALKLIEKGLNVTIIESGSSKNSNNVLYDNVGLDFKIRSTRAIQIGGTSNLWHGVLSPLDNEDYLLRDWINQSGWPITEKDLRPYNVEAAKFLKINKFDNFDIKNLDNNLKSKISILEYNNNLFENKIFIQPNPPVSFNSELKKVFSKSSTSHLYSSLTGLQFEKIDNKTCLIAMNDECEKVNIKAEYFIIATGALETPRLLLNSKFKNKNIGKYLMDHPMGNLCQISLNNKKDVHIYNGIKFINNSTIKSGIKFKEETQRKHKLPNHCFYPRISFHRGINDKSETVKLSLLAFKDKKVKFQDILNLVKNPNIVAQILIYKFALNIKAKYLDLYFITEQLPNIDSTVGLSNIKDKFGYPIAKVNWQLLSEDYESILKTYNLLRSCFPENNYEFIHSKEDLNWKEILTSAAHHVGTARMGNNESEGAVNKNLQLFESPNIFVCDGSVFPTAGNVNSGLTISSLACRLASYLKSIYDK